MYSISPIEPAPVSPRNTPSGSPPTACCSSSPSEAPDQTLSSKSHHSEPVSALWTPETHSTVSHHQSPTASDPTTPAPAAHSSHHVPALHPGTPRCRAMPSHVIHKRSRLGILLKEPAPMVILDIPLNQLAPILLLHLVILTNPAVLVSGPHLVIRIILRMRRLPVNINLNRTLLVILQLHRLTNGAPDSHRFPIR